LFQRGVGIVPGAVLGIGDKHIVCSLGPEAIPTPIENYANGDASFRQAKFDWNRPIW
jgi:hypothetical protein